MLGLILSAIFVGGMLSLALIGPVFFMIIETSLYNGIKSAIILNLGVIFSDIISIILAYYSSKEITEYMQNNPLIFKLCGIVIFLYGLFLFFSKKVSHFKNKIDPISSKIYLFFKGFFFNFVNIGVIIFWISVILFISTTYSYPYKFILYITIVLITSFSIDLIKIFLAGKFHNKFKNKLNPKIRKIIALILIIFSIVIFIKSFSNIQIKNKYSDQLF